MKILYLTGRISGIGGTERILSLKINYFIKEFNYEISVIEQGGEKDIYFLDEDKRNIILKDLNINFDSKQNFLKRQLVKMQYIYYFHKTIKETLKKEKYDFIITTGTIIDFLLPFLYKKECILLKEFHLTSKVIRRNFLRTIFQNFYLSKYNKIIILTNEDKENWNLSNIKVIPNSLVFYPEQISKCKNKKIISVGRLEKQKGYDILIDIWNIISKKYPDWILEIYGEGPNRKNLENKINELGLEKSLLLKGAVKNIQDKYLESSIYVMSSRYEGMPMVLLEAMACGLPVVSFDCPCGPKDIIQNNEDGFIVKFGNIEQMVEKIEELIIDEEKRKLFGVNARRNIQRFSKDKIMIQWKEFFEELVRNK